MIALCMAMLDEPEDKATFEYIYNHYRRNMLAAAQRVLNNYHDAEEAVSQAFLSAAKNFSNIKGRSEKEIAAYLNITTKNAALDIYRKQKRTNSVPFEEAEELPDGKSDVSDAVLSDMGYNRIVAAIKSLPEAYAEALYLFNVTGLSIKQIAVSLGVSEDTIKKRLQRARTKLRVILEEQGITV